MGVIDLIGRQIVVTDITRHLGRILGNVNPTRSNEEERTDHPDKLEHQGYNKHKEGDEGRSPVIKEAEAFTKGNPGTDDETDVVKLLGHGTLRINWAAIIRCRPKREADQSSLISRVMVFGALPSFTAAFLM